MFLKTKVVQGKDGFYLGFKGLSFDKKKGKWIFEAHEGVDAPGFESDDLSIVVHYVRNAGFKIPRKSGQRKHVEKIKGVTRQLYYLSDGYALVLVKGCVKMGDVWRFTPPKGVAGNQLNVPNIEALVSEILAWGIDLPDDFGQRVHYDHNGITIRKSRLTVRLGPYPFWPDRKTILFPHYCDNSFNDAMRSALRLKQMVKDAALLIP